MNIFNLEVDNDGNHVTDNSPPPYEILIVQHKGNTVIDTFYYLEDKS